MSLVNELDRTPRAQIPRGVRLRNSALRQKHKQIIYDKTVTAQTSWCRLDIFLKPAESGRRTIEEFTLERNKMTRQRRINPLPSVILFFYLHIFETLLSVVLFPSKSDYSGSAPSLGWFHKMINNLCCRPQSCSSQLNR